MNKTKIVATLGPSSETIEVIEKLILNGMNTARFNMSHGTHEDHLDKINKVKAINKKLNKNVSLLLDTKGPEIRLGDFKDSKALLVCGKTFTLTTRLVEGDDTIATVSYKELPKDVSIGSRILLADGLVELEVTKIKGKDITCKIINTGIIKSKKGVNVPSCKLSFPALNEQDKKDIKFGLEAGVNYIALSFVRNVKDILTVRSYISSLKIDEKLKDVKLIAKIENEEGIENFDEILKEVDGIMIARGDMGVEVPVEKVPIYQKQMIKKCIKNGKIAITATQMLESMIQNPRPTRAEVSDVANAIYDGTTAIMLSGETASGEYPVECVSMMQKIAEETEENIDYWSRFKKNFMDKFDEHSPKKVDDVTYRKQVNFAVCTSAMFTNAKAIISISHHGKTPEVISSLRPRIPTYVFTANRRTYEAMSLEWGIEAIYIEEFDFNSMLEKGIKMLLKENRIKKKDVVILAGGTTAEDNNSGDGLSLSTMGAVIKI